MSDAELVRLLLAVLLPAPFAFRMAAVVRDGREYLVGGLYLVLSGGIAALVCFLSGSLLLAVPAPLAVILLLSHARFLGAHCAPLSVAGAPAPLVAPTAAEGGRVPDSPPPDALHAGMAFIGDMLESADRIGELRHKRRLRKLERQQAERQAGGHPAAEVGRPPIIRVRPTQGFPKLPPPDQR